MKTVLTAAAIATLSLAPNPPARAAVEETQTSYETRQRESRHQREERLRQAQRRAQPTPRETRSRREEHLRDPD